MAIPIAEDPYSGSNSSYYSIWPTYDYYDNQPPPPSYRPDSLESICAITKFTRREVQIIYRSFKQGCPSGIVNLQQFQEIFSHFFPQGNTKRYARLVFDTLDMDQDGMINFEEFVRGLSTLVRGTLEEKFAWIFQLYDSNKRGLVGPQELLVVIQSMYELLGRNTMRTLTKTHVQEHVMRVYKAICEAVDKDRWRSGGTPMEITQRQFMKFCLENETFRDSLHLFDTVL